MALQKSGSRASQLAGFSAVGQSPPTRIACHMQRVIGTMSNSRLILKEVFPESDSAQTCCAMMPSSEVRPSTILLMTAVQSSQVFATVRAKRAEEKMKAFMVKMIDCDDRDDWEWLRQIRLLLENLICIYLLLATCVLKSLEYSNYSLQLYKTVMWLSKSSLYVGKLTNRAKLGLKANIKSLIFAWKWVVSNPFRCRVSYPRLFLRTQIRCYTFFILYFRNEFKQKADFLQKYH